MKKSAKFLCLLLLLCGPFADFIQAQPALKISMQAGMRNAIPVKTQSIEIKKGKNNQLELVRSESFSSLSIRNTVGILNEVALLDIPEKGNFTTIAIEGYAFTNKEGEPRLPVQVKLIEVPQNADVHIVYTQTRYKDINLKKLGFDAPLFPVQPPVSKSAKEAPAFAYKAEAYSRNAFGSEDLVKVEMLGEARGVRLAKLIISPVQYNPVTGDLRVYTALDFDVEFVHADEGATLRKKAVYHSSAFPGASRKVLNPIETKSVSGHTLPSRSSKKAGSQSTGIASTAFESATDFDNRPLRYVIVADEMFKDSLQPFIRWKTAQGFEVIEAYTSDPEVGNTNTSIQAYLQKLYDEANEISPAPSYLLLVGDTKQIPPFKSRLGADFLNDHVTDLYFAEYTGDILPDLYYGRFSANSVEELMPQIHKTMQMGDIDLDKAAFLDTAIVIAGYDLVHGESHLNPAITYMQNNYINADQGIHCLAYHYPNSQSQTATIIEKFSNGAGFICYTAHGEEAGWSSPAINIEALKQITNKGKYPFVIGNCCLTGKFDVPVCFGEDLLRQPDKGAVIYIGGTNSTYFDEDFYWSIGYTPVLSGSDTEKTYSYDNTGLGAFDCLYHTHGEPFSDWARTAGEVVFSGNMAVVLSNTTLIDYYWEVYAIFGDPSFMAYKNKPETVFAEHEASLVIGSSSFSVQTEAFARVALTRDGHILGVAMADSTGKALVEISELNGMDPLTLKITSQFKAPYTATLDVVRPEGKYVYISRAVTTEFLKDEAVEEGRYNGEYDVYLTLNNMGDQTVNKVRIEFASDDPYFMSEVYRCEVETVLQPGSTIEIEEPMPFRVSSDVPDNYTVKYTLRLYADNDSQAVEKKQKFLVKAPAFRLDGFSLDDSDGSVPNGVLDNGETVKGKILISNIGGTTALGTKLNFSSDQTFLVLPESDMEIGDFLPGSQKTIDFEYSAKDAGVHYALYTLFFNLTTENRTDVLSGKSYISPVMESFETGDFTFVNWDTLSSDWVISEVAYEGKYSAASAAISDDDTSALTITVDAVMDDVISFYYKTSTELVNEDYGDFLRFYIDGDCKDRWAGEKDWTFASYPISAGTHTFTWAFVKDESDRAGQDKVWIDQLRLPIGSKEPQITVSSEASETFAEYQALSITHVGHDGITVKFDMPAAMKGALYVVNTLGQKVKVLSSALQVEAGSSEQTFTLQNLPNGLYICVFEPLATKTVSSGLKTAKFVVVR